MILFFIDDDPLVIKSFKRTLRRFSDRFEVHFFMTSEEALDNLERYAPAICFTDRKMPNMDGTELLRRIRERDPGVYRVLISGDTPEQLSRDSYDLFLEKPVSTAEILNVIDKRAADV